MPELVWGATGFAAVLGLAVFASSLADDRGQPPLAWFVVGLLLPGVAVLILLVAVPVVGARDEPTVDDAVEGSPVARALAAQPHLSVHALSERTGLPEREVVAHLDALRTLGRAERDPSGRWRLVFG